jgi:hypothetical protein
MSDVTFTNEEDTIVQEATPAQRRYFYGWSLLWTLVLTLTSWLVSSLVGNVPWIREQAEWVGIVAIDSVVFVLLGVSLFVASLGLCCTRYHGCQVVLIALVWLIQTTAFTLMCSTLPLDAILMAFLPPLVLLSLLVVVVATQTCCVFSPGGLCCGVFTALFSAIVCIVIALWYTVSANDIYQEAMEMAESEESRQNAYTQLQICFAALFSATWCGLLALALWSSSQMLPDEVARATLVMFASISAAAYFVYYIVKSVRSAANRATNKVRQYLPDGQGMALSVLGWGGSDRFT